jgi:hypothetical protein
LAIFRVGIDLRVARFDQPEGVGRERVDGFHKVFLDLLGDNLGNALLFVEPVPKACLDGMDAAIIDRFGGWLYSSDLLVGTGAPSIQIEYRNVMVPNRGLRL